jgi:hypothetical protein
LNTFQKKFKNKDSEIEKKKLIFASALESDKFEDTKMVDGLDLFAFNEIIVNGKKTNALLEFLRTGNMKMLKYCF